MYQDKEYIDLSQLGYADIYIFTIDGKIYNKKTQKELKLYKHTYKLKCANGQYRTVSLKTLYRQAFKKEYCIDNIEDLENEKWHYIENTNNLYLVSTQSRVKSLIGYEAKLLKGYDTGNGYLKVKIKKKNRPIHILVATAFIENDQPELKDTIDHINGDKLLNTVDNLQWLSRADNVKKYYQQKKEMKDKQ